MADQTIDMVARKELADAAQVITAMAMRMQAMLNRLVMLEQRVLYLENTVAPVTQPEAVHVES